MMTQNRVSLKKNRILWMIIASVCIGILYSYRLSQFQSIAVVNDEFGYWGIAAFLSGKKWNSLMGSTPYYSFGYSLLLIPLYLLNLSPATMYQVALCENVLFAIGAFWLSMLCSRDLCQKSSFKQRFIYCVVVSLYTNSVVQAQLAWTETLLYFLFWLLTYIFIRNMKKISYKNLFAGIVVVVYMYSVHQRVLAIVILYLGLLFLFLIFGKQKDYKKTLYIVVSAGVLLIFYSQMKDYLINSLFTNDQLVNMNNIQGQTGKIANILMTKSGFITFIQSLLGKLYYISVATFYLVPIAIIGCWKKIWSGIKKLLFFKVRNIEKEEYVSLFVVGAFVSILMITAISMYISEGRLDLLVYGRYMEIAIGPVLLIGLYRLSDIKDLKREILFILIIVFLSTIVIDNGFIQSGSNDFNGICATTINYFFKDLKAVSGIAFIISLVMSIPLLLLYLINKNNKDTLKGYIIVSCFWIFFGFFPKVEAQQSNIMRNINPIIDVLESENVRQIVYIYNINEINDGETYVKYLQFLCPDISVIKMEQRELSKRKKLDDKIIVCDRNIKFYNKIKEKYELKGTTKELNILKKKGSL